jgi:hypothetical protein
VAASRHAAVSYIQRAGKMGGASEGAGVGSAATVARGSAPGRWLACQWRDRHGGDHLLEMRRGGGLLELGPTRGADPGGGDKARVAQLGWPARGGLPQCMEELDAVDLYFFLFSGEFRRTVV